jgi:hypothetical protein
MEIHWDKSIDLSARNKEKEAFFKNEEASFFDVFFKNLSFASAKMM